MALATKSATQALVLSLGLLLGGCFGGPLINLSSPTTGANIAPSPETQPTLCTAVKPIYIVDPVARAAMSKDLRDEIAIQNRLLECVCDDTERKTKECKLFLLGSK